MTLRASVHGRVQGVGFRLFVLEAARDLDLRGYVRNMHDGSVYVIAAGPRETLERLLRLLHQGPSGAHVASVGEEWTPGVADGLGHWFEVRH